MAAAELPYFGAAEMSHVELLTLRLRVASIRQRMKPSAFWEAEVERRRVLLHDYICRMTGVWL